MAHATVVFLIVVVFWGIVLTLTRGWRAAGRRPDPQDIDYSNR